jgi:hypothetical protein
VLESVLPVETSLVCVVDADDLVVSTNLSKYYVAVLILWRTS